MLVCGIITIGGMREWPYKNVQPRIIAEQYLEDKEYGELRDYKFFCFNGVVKALFVASERMVEGEETKFDFLMLIIIICLFVTVIQMLLFYRKNQRILRR